MANKLLKHLLGYGDAGNAGNVVADDAALAAVGSTAAVGVCTDWSGNIYLSDTDEHIIIKVTEDGIVSLFAGKAGESGRTNGVAADARFSSPMGISCDRSGNIYVADYGNNQIRKLDSNGKTALLAGDASGASGLTNGANLNAQFNAPLDVTVDYSGNVYVSDSGNNKIRVITGTNTYDVAGSATGSAGDVIGQGTAAEFDGPYGICCDRSGEIFVADSNNRKIKKITTDGTVSLVVGPAFYDGLDEHHFHELKYLKVDNSGFIYVVDYRHWTQQSRTVKFNQTGLGGLIVDYDVTNIGIAVSPNQSVYVTESEVEFESGSSESSVSSSSLSSASSQSR